MPHGALVGGDCEAGAGGERNKPLQVANLQMGRAGPDGFLIVKDVARSIAQRHIGLGLGGVRQVGLSAGETARGQREQRRTGREPSVVERFPMGYSHGFL